MSDMIIEKKINTIDELQKFIESIMKYKVINFNDGFTTVVVHGGNPLGPYAFQNDYIILYLKNADYIIMHIKTELFDNKNLTLNLNTSNSDCKMTFTTSTKFINNRKILEKMKRIENDVLINIANSITKDFMDGETASIPTNSRYMVHEAISNEFNTDFIANEITDVYFCYKNHMPKFLQPDDILKYLNSLYKDVTVNYHTDYSKMERIFYFEK